MARRYRRRRSAVRNLVYGLAVVAACYGGYILFFREGPDEASLGNGGRLVQRPDLRTDRPVTPSDQSFDPVVTEKGADEPSGTEADGASVDARRAASLLAAGREQLALGNWVTARQHLSEAMQLGVEAGELTQLRADLTRIGDETIFSQRVLQDDPLADWHIVQAGETLGNIARRFNVTAEMLARINGIKDINRIREAQTIKVLHGPFHAVVNRKRFTLDAYLGNTFVRAYRVGLGAADTTPTGTWKVKNKLVNPTYYPPRGGKIIGADDPNNPLAERWIGLEGVTGQALGQLRYGIHGTIKPDSIGRSVSLGCIRMHNTDVEFFYDMIVVESSTVKVE